MRVSFLLTLLFTCFNLQSQVINEDLVNKHISYLSSDELEGRKSGTQGIELAAQYIEEEFERIGLKKFNSKDYTSKLYTRFLATFFNIFSTKTVAGYEYAKASHDMVIVFVMSNSD